ncbi:uncharacterized protein LOC124533131 [Vanessa cardui]|uniref:uncharacterized protein LOC124533131 n=1 Tax=Vanessa cardui TaxID=171605 RepID=UPI001F1365EE|nr:uncharacterized protein LOC124533131 [Vanessa cardui]
MSSPISISDDDDSFDVTPSLIEVPNMSNTIVLSDDEDEEPSQSDVKMARRGIIKNLFPTTSKGKGCFTKVETKTLQNKPQHDITMEGVKVTLPVDPYSCQKAVMSKVICALNRKENCMVESPTGTGKTLALLCATLAWQKKFQDQISESQAKDIIDKHPEVVGAVDYITSPLKKDVPFPENFFSRKSFARVTCAAGRGRGGRHRRRREPASGRRVAMATTPRHPPRPPLNRNHPYKQRHTAHDCSLIYHPTHKGTLHKTVFASCY